MMRFFGPEGGATVWYDLCDPTPEEAEEVARATGLRVPTREQISEIESSSRLNTVDGVLYLSTPSVTRTEDGAPVTTPLGFVLARHVLISVRLASNLSFDRLAERFDSQAERPTCSMDAFVGLFETLTDRTADVLEVIGGKLDTISSQIFHIDDAIGAVRPDQALFGTLRSLGQFGDHVHKVRDALLGARRVIGYVHETAQDWTPAPIAARLATLLRDIESLREYDDEHLSNKIQFLLDATLGFVNILQNNTFKVLTVISLVGIPPTLLAGIWGMNFKNMPELNWPHGYLFAWICIVLSGIVPVVWFRAKRWI